jgi:tRNA (adenine57-N1/adenine58-N1)-methyltransferase catalytic subunit
MPINSSSPVAQDGDLAQLVGLRHKHFILTLKAGADFQTHRGVLLHDDLIGKSWGTQVFSHSGSPFFLVQPSMADLLIDLPRNTQILYPKDIGYILITMGVAPGQTVVEAGTGSGSMTIAMASAVGPEGRVISYEQKPDTQNLARKNLARVGLSDRVEFKLRDITEGMDETNVPAFFLDVPNAYDLIPQVRAVLRPGGFMCAIIPTFNQVEKTLYSLRRNNFAFVETCELLLRFYKSEPSRIRPTDRMVAHTGFLVFARRIEPVTDERGKDLIEEIGSGELEER